MLPFKQFFRINFLFMILALLCFIGREASGNPGVFKPIKNTGKITLDGILNEPVWKQAELLPLTMIYPQYKGPLAERSEVRITYDEYYLYAGAHMFTKDPSTIRGNSLTRDRGSDSDDFFAIILDTFNDNENALAFMTTPAGIRADMTIQNDADNSRGRAENNSWNTFWDVATSIDSSGWHVEMRIPFNSLRFEDHDGKVTMGLITWRFVAAATEGHIFPAISPDWDNAHNKPSQAIDMVLEGVYGKNPLYLTPFVLGGNQVARELNNPETAYLETRDRPKEIGLDLKYSLTSNLTLDLTVNTDFAQVEADDEQVNLTRFSLFFPEKRLFFQERSSIYEFNTGGMSRLFYSRRIGLDDDGNQVDIYGGARLVGRVGEWDVGGLVMQTAESDALPSENFSVWRARRRIINNNSYIGGMLTSRISGSNDYNIAYGLDGIIRTTGDQYLTFNWAQSIEDSLREKTNNNPFNAGRFNARYERRNNRGCRYRADIAWSGADYNPGVGFTLRDDYTQAGGNLKYGWIYDTGDFLSSQGLGIEAEMFSRNSDGILESAYISPEWNFGTKVFSFGEIRLDYQHENIDESFDLSDDVEILAGKYNFLSASVFYHTPFTGIIRSGIRAQAGQFFDGNLYSLAVFPGWTVSKYFELNLEYEFNHAEFASRDSRFTAHVGRVKFNANLDTHLSGNLFVQYNSLEDRLGINFRIRYNFSEGHDLYFVYNEGFNTNVWKDVPRRPHSFAQTILAKYAYTMQL